MEVDALIRSLQRSQATNYLYVTSAALFMWDHVVTFQDEVELVWSSRWGAGKALFLLVRYMTWPEVIAAASQEIFHIKLALCQPLFEYVVWSTLIAITAVEMILILRTWAIWNGNRIILTVLLAVLVVMASACCYPVKVYISRTHFIAADTLSPHLRGCFVTASTRLVTVPWIAYTVFDFVIVILTMIKGLQHLKHVSSGFIVSLYRDGLLYFVYLFVISLGNILVLYLAPAEYTILLAELQRVFYTILSCRIILHLRAAHRAHSGPDSTAANVGQRVPTVGQMPVFRRRRDDVGLGGVSAWFGNTSMKEGVGTGTWDSQATEVELCPST